MKVLSIFGTRPEAIKMAPLVAALGQEASIKSVVCVTGQHREMLDQVMSLFDLTSKYDLGVMVPNQTLNGLFARAVERIDAVLEEEKPDYVLVHGDTSTASACALGAFHRRIPVGHVEAGLRTGDLARPFPEEMNRRVVDAIGDWLFAPTATSKANLLREHLQGRIAVTGNTVIDALAILTSRLRDDSPLSKDVAKRYPWVDTHRRMLLVTGHRRESFGDGFRNICAALADLARRRDLQIVYPVHLNPAVRDVVMRELSGFDNVHLIDPLDYVDFVWFMQRAYIILTDSGGVQEEAPFLGRPVLVMRDVTERPEAVEAGTVALVGAHRERIVSGVTRLLDDLAYHASFSRRINPYGDGHAAKRIVDALCGRPFAEFDPCCESANNV
ncbi:non-hydrolyzing UDP-N-acetylglucosamine 2-epimerase [Pandoraea commovens]|uniref:UDP-N-acetylglucosamine 2-epimerase (non-hydrolyzing) n=1 Tax=Pandoraea commovens TaxID=2508289 RepID=A0A5E4TAV4_9BURK|nr:UDP-N-acetylglucosamine 2-epimerase (non-hydrolyzing) [Pandoraea commovens]UVA79281.1 UDP-N-acetylglucosamine 2-epimerase (non-hydrolyzing) [Pandoraea commovens]VVD84392.1 UDP-N-acetylglucosamine 2-epimerase [Pandoraea commovens]